MRKVTLALRKVRGNHETHHATRSLPHVVAIITQGKRKEADALYLRAIEIQEGGTDQDDPNLAVTLARRASLLKDQVRRSS